MENEQVEDKKFVSTETDIAKTENIILSNGKNVMPRYDENHELHIKIHSESKNSNMLMKSHIEEHEDMMEEKEMSEKRKMAVEKSMLRDY